MAGPVIILYFLIFILAATVLFLLARLISVRSSLRRLRIALAKLEGKKDFLRPEDVPEDNLGG